MGTVDRTEKEKVRFATGCAVPVAWSATCEAKIVTVTLSPSVNGTVGVRVKLVGPPVTLAARAPLDDPTKVNQLPVTSTGVLKMSETDALGATFTAPLIGVLVEIAGTTATGGALVSNVRSSIANPSSLPPSSTSDQRRTSV